MKWIILKRLAGQLSGEVWEGDLVEAAEEDGLNINVYNSPEDIDAVFPDEEDRLIAGRFKAEAEAVGYPAARVSELNSDNAYWVKAEGDYELDAALRFYEDFGGALCRYIAVPDKKEAAFWMRYRAQDEKAGHYDPEARLIRSLASKILRGEA